MKRLVYLGPNEMVSLPGLLLILTKDEPQEVTDEVAEIVMSNNPEPWQPDYLDRFQVLDVEGGTE